MKQEIITVSDLEPFMGIGNYYRFIKHLKKKFKIPEKEIIWIIAEWSEKNDR